MSNSSDDAMMEQWKQHTAEAEARAIGPVPLELAQKLLQSQRRLMETLRSTDPVIEPVNGSGTLSVEEGAEQLRQQADADRWDAAARTVGAASMSSMLDSIFEQGMHLLRVDEALVRLAEQREGVARDEPAAAAPEIKIEFTATPAFPINPNN